MQERKCSLTAALPFLYPGLFQGLSRLSQTVINSYRICNIRCSSNPLRQMSQGYIPRLQFLQSLPGSFLPHL